MIDPQIIVQLRKLTGVGIVECKHALEETNNDIPKAIEYLRLHGQSKLSEKMERTTNEGYIEAYIHSNGRVGVLVDLRCETDFVGRNEVFRELAHNIALHVAAMNPFYVTQEQVPAEVLQKEKEIYEEEARQEGKPQAVLQKIVAGKIEKFYAEKCLLKQTFIKDDTKKIEDIIIEAINSLGENIRVERFTRFAL